MCVYITIAFLLIYVTLFSGDLNFCKLYFGQFYVVPIFPQNLSKPWRFFAWVLSYFLALEFFCHWIFSNGPREPSLCKYSLNFLQIMLVSVFVRSKPFVHLRIHRLGVRVLYSGKDVVADYLRLRRAGYRGILLAARLMFQADGWCQGFWWRATSWVSLE